MIVPLRVNKVYKIAHILIKQTLFLRCPWMG